MAMGKFKERGGGRATISISILRMSSLHFTSCFHLHFLKTPQLPVPQAGNQAFHIWAFSNISDPVNTCVWSEIWVETHSILLQRSHDMPFEYAENYLGGITLTNFWPISYFCFSRIIIECVENTVSWDEKGLASRAYLAVVSLWHSWHSGLFALYH